MFSSEIVMERVKTRSIGLVKTVIERDLSQYTHVEVSIDSSFANNLSGTYRVTGP